MAKRIGAGMLCLLLCFLLFGCGGLTYQSINDLLRAPALGGGYDEIQKALTTYLGAEPQYKYPKEGDNRSPIVRVDLNGDGKDEAVLLYSVADTASAGRVFIAVMEQVDEGWQVVQNQEGLNTEVASVEVAQLLEGDGAQLIVGYAQSNLTNKTFVVYKYKNQQLESALQRDYSRYDIGEFTGRGAQDMVVVSRYDDPGSITLEYITTEGGAFVNMGEPVPLNSNFYSCDNISPGVTESGQHILVVDGTMDDGRLFSQIVEYSTSAGFYTVDDSGAMRLATARANTLLLSRDIDGDGMVEIPVPVGSVSTPAADKRLEFVEWMDFTAQGSEGVSRQFGLVDSDRSVYFRLPEEWQGNLAVTDGDNKGEWRLTERDSRKTLLSVHVVDVGESPPPGAQRVLGATNSYLVLGTGLLEAERDTIAMTLLSGTLGS